MSLFFYFYIAVDFPANSNESFCSSDVSLDGSNFDHLDDDTDSLSLNNLELQSTGSSGQHNHHHHHHQHQHGHHHHHHQQQHNQTGLLGPGISNNSSATNASNSNSNLHHNHHHHHHHSLHHHQQQQTPGINAHDLLSNLTSSFVNPIDKLYLMQNSYFQGDS